MTPFMKYVSIRELMKIMELRYEGGAILKWEQSGTKFVAKFINSEYVVELSSHYGNWLARYEAMSEESETLEYWHIPQDAVHQCERHARLKLKEFLSGGEESE